MNDKSNTLDEDDKTLKRPADEDMEADCTLDIDPDDQDDLEDIQEIVHNCIEEWMELNFKQYLEKHQFQFFKSEKQQDRVTTLTNQAHNYREGKNISLIVRK